MTLSLFREAAAKAATQAVERAAVPRGAKTYVRVDRGPDSWIFEQAFLDAFVAAGATASFSDSAAADLFVQVNGPSLDLRFSDAWQDGLFGTSFTERAVRASLRCAIWPRSGGAPLVSQEFEASIIDTIRVDDAGLVQNPAVASTVRKAPAGSFLDDLAEPFLIVGATGVAVYLLFNIRTSP